MARPKKYVSRSDLGWGSSPAGAANISQGLVIHYDSGNQNLANKNHSACLTYWRNTRSFHRGPSRGWVDVGYSFMSCAHGYILEGRGLRKQQAAQPGGNATHYSCTLATGPNDAITDLQINAVRELRSWLVDDHKNNGRVLKHSDFISTSCPGAKASKMVDNGTFSKAPGAVVGGNGMTDIIGLKEGDGKGDGLKENVIYLQRILHRCGFSDQVGEIDGHWGTKTTKGLLALRKSVGSTVTNANSVTGTAAYQLDLAFNQKEADRRIKDALKDFSPGTGGGDGTLPKTETVQVSGTMEIKR